LVTTYCVAVFPGQDLDPVDQVSFAKRLGSLLWTPGEEENTEWPDILQFKNEGREAHRTGVLHTDTCFIAEPPSFTMLSAIEVPAHGGDTLFSNQYLAYDDLSPLWTDMLDSARVLHAQSGVANPDLVPDPVWHPAVRVHPVTGRPSLTTAARSTPPFTIMVNSRAR
jgi:taurine dioxygenase